MLARKFAALRSRGRLWLGRDRYGSAILHSGLWILTSGLSEVRRRGLDRFLCRK